MSNKMWGGRFAAEPDAIMAEINVSIDVDRNLYRQDIVASKVHAQMLAEQGIISAQDAKKIVRGLDTVLSEIEAGQFEFKRALEDIHMNVEARLTERIGEAGGRLHTARSRNDQVALDLRLFLREEIDQIRQEIRELQQVLADLAERHPEAVMPGYTHMQKAQVITFAHYLMAYYYMLKRDRQRMQEAMTRIDVLPLGSGAIAAPISKTPEITYPSKRPDTARPIRSGVSPKSIFCFVIAIPTACKTTKATRNNTPKHTACA